MLPASPDAARPLPHFLIVEDDPLCALDAAMAARDQHLQPIVVDSVADALSALENIAFSGAIIDFMVRDGNTARIIHCLKGLGVPFGVVSGTPVAEIAKAGAPCSAIYRKPLAYDRILPKLLG